ncbi:MAG: hypothetical protein GY861_14405 [bacterium]|nr:hypothetical protein [bacterium]
MAQTTYAEQTGGGKGLLADSGNRDIESMLAYEEIEVGLGLVKRVGYDNQARLPKINKTIITMTADLVAGDIVDISINGNAIASYTYAVSHNASMTAIAALVQALTGIDTAVSSARIITVLADDGVTISTVTEAVTNGGAGTAVASSAESTTDDTLYAVASQSNFLEQDADGVVSYAATETLNGLRSGRLYVYVEEAVTSDDTVYLRFLANGATKIPGQFRKSADSSKAFACSNCRFVTSAGAGEYAILELGLMGV